MHVDIVWHDLHNTLLLFAVTCFECKKPSVTLETSDVLSIDMPKASTVGEGLRLLFSPQLLSGVNKYRCNVCNALRPGTSKMSLETPPNVLIVQLQRLVNAAYSD